MKKRVCVIGSTGYIGRASIDILKKYPDHFDIASLIANTNASLLATQAADTGAKFSALISTDFDKVIRYLKETELDYVVLANAGSIGAKLLLASATKNRRLLVANKESIIMLGHLLADVVNKNQIELIPLDSEHNSIFQLINADPSSYPLLEDKNVSKLVITASGGPFLHTPLNELKYVSTAQATKHPNWQMGAKISVDSATMANKALELIETHILFGTKNVDTIIHPQSIVHAFVHYQDGAVLSSLNNPDMRIPISNGLFYPNREPSQRKFELKDLTFIEVDEQRFPLIRLAKELINIGKDSFIYFNIINEMLVHRFLVGKIRFDQISTFNLKLLENIKFSPIESIDEIFIAEKNAMNMAQNFLNQL